LTVFKPKMTTVTPNSLAKALNLKNTPNLTTSKKAARNSITPKSTSFTPNATAITPNSQKASQT